MHVQANPLRSEIDSIKKFDRMFFGHPLGLLVLSMNEIWERFSYYGMKAILILYMVAGHERGGMALSYGEAAAVYALYSSLGAAMILPGGWIADMLWGQRRALLIGGIVITFGHCAMAVSGTTFFFIGLALIILGTGLLKPSSTTMVSQLYPEGDARQESGYTIYYMCINVGSLFGPLVCGYLGQRVSWHMGFAAAAFGMVVGVAVYILGGRILGDIGMGSAASINKAAVAKNYKKLIIWSLAIAAVVVVLSAGNVTNVFRFSFGQLSQVLGSVLILLPIVYLFLLLKNSRWTRFERNNLIVIAMLFFFSIFFWAAADQRGSLFTFFADEVTRCTIGSWNFPSTWFTAVNPALIILLTPLFAWLWPALGRRNPSAPAKFAWAMFFTAASFAVMIAASMVAGPARERVGPQWLLVNILLITIGEMCLSPVGISAFARLAPQSIVSQVMGIWFLRGAIAGLLAGAAGGAYNKIPLAINFGLTAVVVTGIGFLIIALTPVIKRLTNNPGAYESDAGKQTPS